MRVGRLLLGVGMCGVAAGQAGFVNFESPHVHPLELTPSGQRLLAVNTADNRLEVFAIGSGGTLTPIASVPVGQEPVSVRARSDGEAWVVNHLSDTVSVVSLSTFQVIATLATGDEPADVVFAGAPQRAFVSVSQENRVRVFDPADLLAPAVVVTIQGEDPRALVTDGARVYAAVFESGNRTTILSPPDVNSPASPYPGRPNPPPNAGNMFSPPMRAGNPPPRPVGLVVKKAADGTWRDDNNRNWSNVVTWDLLDHDVAVIDANSLSVSYVSGLMNANMALAVGPGSRVSVVGTDAINHVRFEPNANSVFVRVLLASFDAASGGGVSVSDLNPHLTYSTPTIPPEQRALSIGDPRAIVWNSTGTVGYVAGLGSNSVIRIGPAGERLGQTMVGEGPTGLALHEASGRLFVLDRFEGAISVIDTGAHVEVTRRSFFDPTPQEIRAGRPFLFNTHRTSGLGQASCGSCHIDGRTDALVWDLGDPAGTVKPFNQICQFGNLCEDWHPMKGTFSTQTLFGLTNVGPMHWRGDREDFTAFNPAFVSLLGRETQLTPVEMEAFTVYINTLRFPPNPFRSMSGALPNAFANGGSAVAGQNLFNVIGLAGTPFRCVTCHALPDGTSTTLAASNLIATSSQSLKTPHLRDLYEKTGFSRQSASNTRGFGFSHDGHIDTIASFLNLPMFLFAQGGLGAQQRRDVEAFLMSFSVDMHAGVGAQAFVDSPTPPTTVSQRLDTMLTVALTGATGLIAKGQQGGVPRGYAFDRQANVFRSDVSGEAITPAALRAAATASNPLTFTLVPVNSQTRQGIDRDGDGFFDRDEIVALSDPSDPNSVPGPACPGDLNGDRVVNFGDLNAVLTAFGLVGMPGYIAGDADADGDVDFSDLNAVLSAFGQSC